MSNPVGFVVNAKIKGSFAVRTSANLACPCFQELRGIWCNRHDAESPIFTDDNFTIRVFPSHAIYMLVMAPLVQPSIRR